MERNVREFLRETGAEELKARMVLSANKGCAYLLQGKNVFPLMEMMRERGVSKLVSHDGKWFLTAEGKFANPKSREAKDGLVKQLEKSGNVFWGQNKYINPYYEPIPEDAADRYESSEVRPFSRITLDPEVEGGKPCIRDMLITVETIVNLAADGKSFKEILQTHPNLEVKDLQEALGYAAKKVSQVNTYLFRVEIEQEEDGRWGATVPAMPGCNAWGYTKEETMRAIKDNTEMFLEVLQEFGDSMPRDDTHKLRAPNCEVIGVLG